METRMAYLARLEPSDAVITLPAMAAPRSSEFTALEWSIIRLARIDDLWTIRPLGPLRRFWNALVGRVNPQLASPQLEALRKMAVLSWHFGFTVPGDAIADFLSEGFNLAQYELLVTSISKAVNSPVRGQSPEAFA
jgi:hypothetical protein